MSSDPVVRTRSAEEAFALLGTPLRVDILRALAETPHEPVRFADLRRRVGERDSGKFNYHLGKLTGSFVRHREPDADDAEPAEGPAGYELTMAGRQVVGALLAGTYTEDAAVPPAPIDATCPLCGATLTAGYEDEQAVVECPDCDGFHNEHGFPPGTVGQFDREELPRAFDAWLRASLGQIIGGFCRTCSGRIDGRLAVVGAVDDPPAADLGFDVAYARYTCERCGDEARTSVQMPLLFHPATVAFLHDHGVDVTTTPSWELSAGVVDSDVELLETDPARVRVTLSLDGDELAVEFDETVTLVDVERRDA